MARRLTPFARWIRAQRLVGEPYTQLAAGLGCTAASIRHYAYGAAVPRPEMLRKLMGLTGLSAEAFLFPFDAANVPSEKAS